MTTELSALERYEAQRQTFLRDAGPSAPHNLERYFWYHTIDLGNGLITPGQYDYRDTFRDFGFPEDLAGKSVLDIGSATGFFAFEFEKRGADVTSVELPSLYELDRFPGQDVETNIRKIERMMFPRRAGPLSEYQVEFSPEELYFFLLEGPYRFCADRLQSRVRRVYSSVYNLTLSSLDRTDGFDLVFLGDVLLHTLRPFDALAAIAPLAGGSLVIAQEMVESGNFSGMVYRGGEDPEEDDVCWWMPTKLCFTQLLKKFGFQRVQEVGKHRGVVMPLEHPFERTILQACR
jgi:tRNA (mo5U34)-methyltransferase